MKNIFKPGEVKKHIYLVEEKDVAAFGDQLVHPVCSTFALGREIEFASRLFIEEMKEEGEEGIGTGLSVNHLAPALPGEKLFFESRLDRMDGNTLFCSVNVSVGERKVASGTTTQKIVKKDKLAKIFDNLRKG